jgi:hypothetical protein
MLHDGKSAAIPTALWDGFFQFILFGFMQHPTASVV